MKVHAVRTQGPRLVGKEGRPVILYHRTRQAAAATIVVQGFRSEPGCDDRFERPGNWLWNTPRSHLVDPEASAVIEVEIPDELLDDPVYAWSDGVQWHVYTELLNRFRDTIRMTSIADYD
jgi:hypothetical protein